MHFDPATSQNTRRLIPGYDQLEPRRLVRMFEFSLVWQLFEGRVFQSEDVAVRIQEYWYRGLHAEIAEQTAADFHFFKHRYQDADDATHRFDILLGDRGENLRLCIQSGLADDANDHQKTRACAAVCYRLRNNLFHGRKADYGFEEQDGNFERATHFMNTCLHVLV
ncbi:hypothetical protein [Sulfitobacter sp. EhC04]|uniref:hypothetical protein n=1 Tax=Sulfitobacter sp. EhC04 TaxID=1849168 RepID=UPI0013735315|nr:hypothetical protein [Sulfitobacter sp. EhC04]